MPEPSNAYSDAHTKVVPLVSVVMPCKDAARFIAAAIESVLAQTHVKLQLIVVDDGSIDQTLSVVEPFTQTDSRVTLVKLADNSGGPAKPRNIGLAHVQGEYLAFIDADDIWLPNKLSFQLAVMEQHGLNFCSTLHRHFKDDAVIQRHSQSESQLESQSNTQSRLNQLEQVEQAVVKRINHAMILRKNSIVTSSVLLRASFLDHLHFSEEAHYVAIEDYVAWLQLHQLPEIESGIIQQPLIFYRTRNDSISSSKFEMAGKIYKLLSLYKVQGKPLGLSRFYYYGTYLFGGVKSLVFSWLNRAL